MAKTSYYLRRYHGLCVNCGKPAKLDDDGHPQSRCEECIQKAKIKGYTDSEKTSPLTICWSCVHSLPNPQRGRGCSWSVKHKPVEGWTAEQTNVNGRVSYRVIKCPKYKKG